MEPILRQQILQKQQGQIPSENLSEQNSKYSNGEIKTNVSNIAKSNGLTIKLSTDRIAFCALLFVRLLGALLNPLPDCGETYNFWEPLHYLLFGSGMQTWEFSPAYAIHSFAYLLVYALPALIVKLLFPSNKVIIFYFVRFLLVFASVFSETYFYKGVFKQFGPKIAKTTFVCLLFNAGMFHSSTALLGCTFSMYMCMISIGAWYQRQYALAVVATATSTLFSWPYAGLIGVGIAIDVLLIKKDWLKFVKCCFFTIVTILVPMVIIDTYFYGRLVIARLNAVLFNVFTEHGPNPFGTSPWTFYFYNGFLNFNLLFPLALASLPAVLVTIKLKPFGNQHGSHIWTTLLPFYLWILIFFSQPHKEERFLFPIYPLIGLAAVVTLTCMEIFVRALKFSEKFSKILTLSLLVSSSILSIGRIVVHHKCFYPPFDIFLELNRLSRGSNRPQDFIDSNVCIGKEWHRFPSSFFLPNQMRLLYLQSDLMKGQLPRRFDPPPEGTWTVPPNMNDLDIEEPTRYSSLKDCHFVVELFNKPGDELILKEWEIIYQVDLLYHYESRKYLGSFHIPFVNERYYKKYPFVLLRRRSIKEEKSQLLPIYSRLLVYIYIYIFHLYGAFYIIKNQMRLSRSHSKVKNHF